MFSYLFLDPLLFVLFVNDLPIVLKRCNILMYADDTVMYFAASASDAQEISSTLTSELAKVNDWLVHCLEGLGTSLT